MPELLSDRILSDNADVFDAMLSHRFVEDIKADRLPDTVFRTYLVYEGAFVETAIRIFAFAVAKAPGIVQQRWLIAVLDALANTQIAYFDKTFARLGLSPDGADLAHPAVRAFREGMLKTATEGSYLDIVASMFCAEWMYWHWCREAAKCSISDPMLAEWVELHAVDDFAAQAKWLKAELDAASATISDDEAASLSATFRKAMELEINFHTAAYATHESA